MSAGETAPPAEAIWPRIRRAGSRAVLWLADRILDGAVVLGRALSARRIAKGKIRTLWGVTPIVTLPAKAACDKALGFSSETVVNTTYYITKAFSLNLRLVYAIGNRLRIPGVMERLILAVALLRYDIFHYYNDRGLFTTRFGIASRELEALNAAGKRVYVFAYGADIRTQAATRALSKWNFCALCPEPGRFCVCDDLAGKTTYQRTHAAVTGFISMADMLAYTPGATNLHYWPIDTDEITQAPYPPRSGPLRIAHAPNHAHFKGSHFLEEAVAALIAEGQAIELVRISGVSNLEVLKLFAEVDIVADQFIGGAYGYTALEGMARGRPVLAYIRDRSTLMAPEECPILNTTPETIRSVLEWCLANRAALPAIGAAGRIYVERFHAIPALSARFAMLYLESAGFPAAIASRLDSCIHAERLRRAKHVDIEAWSHPYNLRDLPAGHFPSPRDI